MCRLHEQGSQILVAALRDLAELGAIAGRLLLRHQSEPSSEVASLTEAGAIADRGHHGARDDRPDPRQRHQPLAAAIILCQPFDLGRNRFDALVEAAPVLSRSAMSRSKRGDSASGGELRIVCSTWRKGAGPWRIVIPRSVRRPRI